MSDEYSEEHSRQLPQNLNAERAVLGSILRQNDIINEVVQIIRADNFYTDAHQKIFSCIISIYEKAQPVDFIILCEQLKVLQQLDDVGGPQYIYRLWDESPTSANAEYYARIIRDKSITRGLINISTEIVKEAYDQALPADELLGNAERKIMEISHLGSTGQTYDLVEALNQAFDRIDYRSQKGGDTTSGIGTGFTELDEKTAGLHKNELIILAARPSVGKTALALNLIRHMITEEAVPVFFVSLEMARIELAERLLCAQSKVNSHNLRKGHLSADDLQKLIEAGETLRKAKLFIDDTPSQTMLRIAANARRLKKRHGIGFVAIDYLQLIEPESRREPRQEQVAQISRRLKFLARELEIPVMALAQVNRSSEDRQDNRPRLADLRESGSIEQDADTCFILHRLPREEGQGDDQMELIIAKQRNGPTGELLMTYKKSFMRFENYTPQGIDVF